MSSVPYMKFYIADYLGDTSHLTTRQHGAYLLLIMAYWQSGGYVRNTDVLLRNITRTTAKEWKEDKIVLDFFEKRGDFLSHPRIEKELAKVREKSDKCRQAIENRWGRADTDVSRTNNGCNTTPIVHSHIPDKKENIRGADKPPKKTFSEPSSEEVRDYCIERANRVDPERFVDFYAAKGWMVGKNKMKDWRAAVRNWEKNDFASGSSRTNTSPALRPANLPPWVCPVCGRETEGGIECICKVCRYPINSHSIIPEDPLYVEEVRAEWEATKAAIDA